MVMTRPPAFHIWKFLMKNIISPNSGLRGEVSVNNGRIMIVKVAQAKGDIMDN